MVAAWSPPPSVPHPTPHLPHLHASRSCSLIPHSLPCKQPRSRAHPPRPAHRLRSLHASFPGTRRATAPTPSALALYHVPRCVRSPAAHWLTHLRADCARRELQSRGQSQKKQSGLFPEFQVCRARPLYCLCRARTAQSRPRAAPGVDDWASTSAGTTSLARGGQLATVPLAARSRCGSIAARSRAARAREAVRAPPRSTRAFLARASFPL